MQLSERGLDASGVSGEVTGGAAALSIKRLIDTRGGRFQPLAVTLRVRPAQADLHVDVGLIAASGGGEARARGIYRPAQRTLDVAVEVPSADLSGVHIEGVDGRVELARLSPPSTQGTQTLRIRRIDRGVALTDVVLDWGLEAREGGEGSRLRIDRLVTQFASGRVLVEDATLDPLAEENRLTFRVEELDLARLFEIVALEGVSATGRVSGTIPVVVRKGAAAVEGASLAAANGLLRIRSESAARMLASGGQSVELLLDALRDFHYDGLRMAIDKQFEGESTVRMTLEGSTPAVLQGHPFRINLNLTGNVDRLLAAFLEIARISDRAVRATVHALE
jgi:hypothetical protein